MAVIVPTCAELTLKRQLLRRVRKLRKAIISFVMSVCPHGATRLPLDLCSWNLTLEDFLKILRKKFSFRYNLSRKTCTLHEDVCTFMTVSRSVLLRMKTASDKSCRENQNKHFMINNVFTKNVAFMRQCGRNMLEPDRPQMII
jgi:hypothetical protein